MAKIEDILSLDLSKIKQKALKDSVKKFVDGYQAEDEKELFIETAKKSIDTLYKMVKDHAPESISSPNAKGKNSPKIKGKNRNIVLEYHNTLLDLSINYEAEAESNDLEGFFQNIEGSLNGFIENAKEEEIPILVKEATKPFYAQAKMLEENQKLRFGSVFQADVTYRDKAVKIVDAMLEELEIKATSKTSVKPKKYAGGSKLRSTAQSAVIALNQLKPDLNGKDKEIIATLRFELDDALDQPNNNVFAEIAAQAIQNFDDTNFEASDEKTQRKIAEIIERLKESQEKTDLKTKSKKSDLSRNLVREVVKELVDLTIDLDGEEEAIIAGTYLHFEESLEIENEEKFENDVRREASEMKHWVDDIDDAKLAEKVITSINKLLKALNEPLLKTPKEKAAKSKEVLEKVKIYDADIEACRAVIRDFNKKKKEGQAPKPKKTRYTKLKEKLIAIAKLTPEHLQANDNTLVQNRKILKETARKLMANWGMNQLKNMETAIDAQYDEMEEKAEQLEQKDNAKKWSNDLPNTDKVIAYEKKHNKHLLEEAALEIVGQITDAIKLYKDDKDKAFDMLKSNLSTEQIEEYLPAYILEEMNQKTKKTN
ncbi:MAG: hypothetical protein JXQ90_18285 [Cyclobacteriaceae bacterium]